MKLISALVFLISSLLAQSTWAGLDEGVAAYNKKDYAAALKQFKSLAIQGDAAAQSNLGLMYDNGQGVPKDAREAVRWFRLAADQGDAIAQFNLGNMYDNGQGVPKDAREAVHWYRLAADQGFAAAQHNLGVAFFLGVGVPENQIAAYALLNISAASGIDTSSEGRDILDKKMSTKEIQAAQDLSREMAKPNNVLKALDAYLAKVKKTK